MGGLCSAVFIDSHVSRSGSVPGRTFGDCFATDMRHEADAGNRRRGGGMNRLRGKSRRVGGRSYALPAAGRQRKRRYVIDRPGTRISRREPCPEAACRFRRVFYCIWTGAGRRSRSDCLRRTLQPRCAFVTTASGATGETRGKRPDRGLQPTRARDFARPGAKGPGKGPDRRRC